jgi:hypothetical protein
VKSRVLSGIQSWSLYIRSIWVFCVRTGSIIGRPIVLDPPVTYTKNKTTTTTDKQTKRQQNNQKRKQTKQNNTKTKTEKRRK